MCKNEEQVISCSSSHFLIIPHGFLSYPNLFSNFSQRIPAPFCRFHFKQRHFAVVSNFQIPCFASCGLIYWFVKSYQYLQNAQRWFLFPSNLKAAIITYHPQKNFSLDRQYFLLYLAAFRDCKKVEKHQSFLETNTDQLKNREIWTELSTTGIYRNVLSVQ